MINSDANTSGESEEENQFDKYTKPTFVQGKPPVKSSASNEYETTYQGNNHFPKSCPTVDTNYRKPISEPNQSTELKVSCSVWQHNAWQKVDLSVMDLSSAIIRKVESIEHSSEYIYLGFIFSFAIALLPTIFRMQYLLNNSSSSSSPSGILPNHIQNPPTGPNNSISSSPPDYTDYFIQVDLFSLMNLFLDASLFFGKNVRLRFVICIAILERFVLSLLYFFLLCVAERTFKQVSDNIVNSYIQSLTIAYFQRFLYSKYFSQITRRDRAKRSQVPFFRLHKVSYLKVWLSVRSYLRRYDTKYYLQIKIFVF